MYRLKVRAKNVAGVYSEFSNSLVVALGSVPGAPSKPEKVIGASGPKQIAVQWNEVTGGTLPIYGYRLYSDLGLDDNFSIVFDGTNKPKTTQYLQSNVTDPSVTYRFYVTAVNFNGEGAASATAQLRSCTLPKAGLGSFDAPKVEAVSST